MADSFGGYSLIGAHGIPQLQGIQSENCSTPFKDGTCWRRMHTRGNAENLRLVVDVDTDADVSTAQGQMMAKQSTLVTIICSGRTYSSQFVESIRLSAVIPMANAVGGITAGLRLCVFEATVTYGGV